MIPKTSYRCPVCKLQLVVCLCEDLPLVTTRHHLTLIVHSVEAKKPTNSGILATRCLTPSQAVVYGSLTEVEGLKRLEDSQILRPQFQPVVLFPSPTSVDIRDFASTGQAIQLIVPDGNWRQASSMTKRIPQIRELPKISLPMEGLSRYRLRREPKTNGLATMEAVARAFGHLEGDDCKQQLLSVFERMVHRCLWQRGQISEAELLATEQHLGPSSVLRKFGPR